MTRYAKEAENPAKASKARGAYLRCHFKHLREVAHNIRGKSCVEAVRFLEDVLKFKRAVTFTKFTGGVGRHAQGKLVNAPGDKVRWPQKATKVVLGLVKNAESNAVTKGLDVDKLVITHIMANHAPQQRRRTYRAHGRINAYMSTPGHFELILAEKAVQVPKAAEAPKLSRKQVAAARFKSVKVGGGLEA
ncbi:ribosomal protein L22/L17 [Tribonema minus]|uniref:Ribosomal protein L22/L17 n=1 Tax=Tribonema minus TaxID=303371 RepID=A0A836C7U9_9STRA|nr:ribosomal protein L22/L17 [Tribonema minus]